MSGLTQEIDEVLAEALERDGEAWEQDAECSYAATGDHDDVLRFARMAHDYAVQAKAINDEVKRLRERLAVKRRAEERCRKIAANFMHHYGRDKLSDGVFTVYWQKRQPTLTVRDEGLLPPEFTKMNIAVDKKALNEHWRTTGEIPDGCEVDEQENSLCIR